MELDADGLFRELEAEAWAERRRLLSESGGPPISAFVPRPS
jgi:hypothetical protein